MNLDQVTDAYLCLMSNPLTPGIYLTAFSQPQMDSCDTNSPITKIEYAKLRKTICKIFPRKKISKIKHISSCVPVLISMAYKNNNVTGINVYECKK